MTTGTMLLALALAAPLVATAEDAPAGAPAPDLTAAPPATAPAEPVPATAVITPIVKEPGPAPKRKHGIFPLWGDAVRAKGFDLPNPYSVMFNYYYQSSDLTINNLQLQFNNGRWRNYDALIQIPKAKATGSALSVRPAIMVFPFLSFYGVFSTGATQTDVSVRSPVIPALAFDTTAKSGVTVVALGATFQMGYKGFFGVADFNGAVSDVERLADTVGANLLSFRLGYAYKLNEEGRKLAGWVGTAGQVIDVKTEGSVRLQSVLPPVDLGCASRPLPLQGLCDDLQAGLNDPNATVNYKLDKKPKDVWNLIVGAQYALDRNWAFRAEATFLGSRYSVFGGAAYEFDIY
jgi:opacity protein-like surface antigen